MPTVFWNRNIAAEGHEKMKGFASAGHEILWFAFAGGGNRWSIITDKTFYNRNIPQECHDKMKAFLAAGHKLRCVAFPPQGGNRWSIITDKTFYNRNVPAECHRIMKELQECHGPLRVVAFDGDGNGWSVVSAAKPVPIYRLPFNYDLAWELWQGNWDDPAAGHGNSSTGMQAYAFDFVHDADDDNVGEAEQNVRAARGGTVYAAVESESGNSWGSGNPRGYSGVGNFLVIEHADGTFGTYWHLKKNGIHVSVGSTVKRGQVIATSGNTGNSSTPHLHFDVRTGWSLGYPADKKEYPTVKVYFEAKDHACWVPRVGDTLASNNG